MANFTVTIIHPVIITEASVGMDWLTNKVHIYYQQDLTVLSITTLYP